ncbi:hypothetical protein MESS2_750016 [Mesorhizobium metallidurans STM 2683]|uniref:Uncharacterized protein n=1 Tax=Mesorhizobium metallidurans STM 2683 TaxID=1297569 RepID=M5EW45_9HYPH|nr:hypothetical protein MESS2_750016 [Mesorhizobium metallidurans STM 2683]
MGCLAGQQSRNFPRSRIALNCDHISSPTDEETQRRSATDYVGFEICEAEALPGKEEYLNPRSTKSALGTWTSPATCSGTSGS